MSRSWRGASGPRRAGGPWASCSGSFGLPPWSPMSHSGPVMPSATSRSSTSRATRRQHRPAPGRRRRVLRGCAARRPTRPPAATRPRAEPRSRPGVGVRGNASFARAAAAAARARSSGARLAGVTSTSQRAGHALKVGEWCGRRDWSPQHAAWEGDRQTVPRGAAHHVAEGGVDRVGGPGRSSTTRRRRPGVRRSTTSPAGREPITMTGGRRART